MENGLKRIAPDPEEKGNPRCLKKLYQTTRVGIEANFDLLVEQAMERQIDAEQEDVGWDERTDSVPQLAKPKMRTRMKNHAERTGGLYSQER